jgi:hypothetical protein
MNVRMTLTRGDWTRPLRWILLFIAMQTGAGSAWAQQPMSVGAAFAEGSAAAAAANPNVMSGINAGTASTNLRRYGNTSPEAGYFAAGQGDTTAPGSSKKGGCVSGPAPSDPEAAQECNAVRFLQDLPGNTPSLGITRADPLLQKGKAVVNDPEALAENFGKTYTGCTATTVTDPGSTLYEVCNEYLAIGSSVCKIERIVEVAVDKTYQCIKTDDVFEDINCNRELSVTVTLGAAGAGKIIVAYIQGAYLFTNGTSGGLFIHGANGAEMAVNASVPIDGSTVGLTYGGSPTRLIVNHNGCESGWCVGNFNFQVFRENGTWWDIVAGSFKQDLVNTKLCPKTFDLTEHWFYSPHSISITTSCIDGGGNVTISYARTYPVYVLDYCDPYGGCTGHWAAEVLSGSATLSPGGSVDTSVAGAPAYIAYAGNGSFGYYYWSHHDSSSDASSWKSISFTMPVRVDAINYSWINNCASLEARSK